MDKTKVVIALGGNALGDTPEEQKEKVKITAKHICDLVEANYKVMVCHGNGPQVGMINNAMTAGHESAAHTPAMAFAECGAMSQGYIGYHLSNALRVEFNHRGMKKVPTCCIVSEMVVDKNDPAFQNPTKPIGGFMSEEQAKACAEEFGWTVKEDAGRGWRRVVPSPKPIRIVEEDALMINWDHGVVPIAGGGGGIPVIENEDGEYEGVAAVIDKDLTSELLAELIDADVFVVLTAVEKVAIRFGKPDQEDLSELTVAEAKKYAEQGEFAPGSMLPKIEAAIKFCESGEGRTALITSLETAKEALAGKTGTRIVRG